MTLEEFEKYYEGLVKEERELLIKKGMEYSGKEDRHANFKRLAVQLKLSPEKILWVYFTKHIDGILSFINGDYQGSEPIKGRIEDARNYLALLGGMIEDRRGI